MRNKNSVNIIAQDSSKVMYENLLPHEFIQRINECPIAYVPLGTLEWHAKHLPLGSDGIQSRGFFQRLAMEIGGIVLPMLFLGPDYRYTGSDGQSYYGMDCHSFESGYPQQLPGSAYYVEHELFNTILDNVVGNLARAGFGIVIAHGHGPSTIAFSARKQIFSDKFHVITHTLAELGFEGDQGIMTDHAAANETSLVMALDPQLADLSHIIDDEIPVSVWGTDPRKHSSAIQGSFLIEKNIDRVVATLRNMVAEVPKPDLVLEFQHVKNLLDKPIS